MKALKNIFIKVICCFLSLSTTIILCNKTYASTKYVWSTNVSTVPTNSTEETPVSSIQNTLNI